MRLGWQFSAVEIRGLGRPNTVWIALHQPLVLELGRAGFVVLGPYDHYLAILQR